MMMEKVNRPPDLIKFASENNIEKGTPQTFNYRLKLYSVALVAILGLLTFLLFSRNIFDTTILRTPGQVLQENADGTISNMYRLKLSNKGNQTVPFKLQTTDPNAKIEFVSAIPDSLASGQTIDQAFFIKVPKAAIKQRKTEYQINVLSGDKVVQKKEAIFIGEY